MKKTFLKKSIIILSFLTILILLLILTLTAYILCARSNKTASRFVTISDSGVTFSLPKDLHVEFLSAASSKDYKLYEIYDRGFPGAIGSNIHIYIPANNRESFKKLSDRVRPEFAQFILPIIIKGHKGEFLTYHLNEQLPGDRPVQAQETTILLNSNYENAPLILKYTKYDGGNSLDDAWEMIIKTLKY